MKNISSQMIHYEYQGVSVPAYLARPNDLDNFPGVVLIQEWWGLVPHIREVADRFAENGFFAMAPDLYHGQVAEEPDEARKLAMGLDRKRAVAEIMAAVDYLQTMQALKPKKIGVVGWCMGGGLALSTASEDHDVGAVVAFYGRPLAPEDTQRIQAPVLGLYGELDTGIPVEVVRTFDQQLAQTGIPHEVHIYPGAPHAFFNDSRPQIYHPQAAADAWNKTLYWFQQYLK